MTDDDETDHQDSSSTPHLHLVETSSGVELVDETLGTWLVRFEGLESTAVEPTRSPGGAVILRSLSEAVPGLAAKLPDRGLRVVFSSDVRKGLASGSYRLMTSGPDALPTAVGSTGKIVQVARIPGGASGGVGGGVALGAGAVAAWPLALAAGVAMAVSWQEQRWLENTLGSLRSAVHRLETRLRDDDFGRLEATDALVDLVADDVLSGALAPQLREELAIARREVEAIYASRRRYVERFKQRLEERQTAHEERTGERTPWQGDTVQEILDGEAGVTDELTLFVAAMMARARVGAVTASQLAMTGDPIRAVRLVESLHTDLAHDYHDLHNRVGALARHDIDLARWRKLTGVGRENADHALAVFRRLDEAMEDSIGARMPERAADLELIA